MRHTLDKYPTAPRHAMVVQPNGGTYHTEFDKLKKGDVFFLLEPESDELVSHRGNAQWVALEDPVDGVILCDSYSPPPA